jgi:hypothetical protein
MRKCPDPILKEIYHSSMVMPTYELYISSSVIKKMFFKHNLREDLCNMNYWWCEIMKRCERRPSESMMKGVYFETQILGSGAQGEALYDLPRHKKTGDKLTDHVRIDELVHMWDQFAVNHDIMVVKEGEQKNTQVRVGPMELDIVEIKEKWPNLKVFLKMDTDLISPITDDDGNHYDMAVIDLKLTQSLTNTFGEFCWGTPEHMDHLQAFLYSFFTGLPFLYVVGEYKDPKYKIFPVNTDRESPIESLQLEAKSRYNETIRRIVDYVDAVMDRETKGLWYYQWPSKDVCKQCIFNDRCKSAKQFKSI